MKVTPGIYDFSKEKAFLAANGFLQPEVSELSSEILKDMKKGLDNPGTADQPMIFAGTFRYSDIPENEKVIVIDAGGTNFRSCLVSRSEGKIKIENLKKSGMPGTEKELSKEEFFSQIAEKLDYLKDSAEKIGFCFSYAMECTKDGDGKILVFSKEIKAKAAIGSYVGKELLEALKNRGWKTVKKIKVINDTTACLLSGLSLQEKYNSLIGFILGTGINNAYIETAQDNSKNLTVCECGMYSQFPQSRFDSILDMNSANPGNSKLEKMCSGVYLGKLIYHILEQACINCISHISSASEIQESIFSKEFSINLLKNLHDSKNFECFKKKEIPLFEVDKYFDERNAESSLTSLLQKSRAKESDLRSVEFLIRQVIGRSASIVAAVLTATVVRTIQTSSARKICIICNGTTFWKTHGLRQQAEEYLKQALKKLSAEFPANLSSLISECNLSIIQVDDDITKGSFAAVFM